MVLLTRSIGLLMARDHLQLYPQVEFPVEPRERPPTARQLAVLEFIRKTLKASNRAPSVDEIRAFFGLRSKNAIRKHLDALEGAGLIKKARGCHRNIILVDNSDNDADEFHRATGRAIPILGEISRRGLSDANKAKHETVTVDALLYPQPGLFALRAKGDGMQDVHICDGDLVLITSGVRPEDGDLAYMRLDDDAFVKRVCKMRVCDGSDRDYEPDPFPYTVLYANSPREDAGQRIHFADNGLTIIGKVVGVLRQQ